MALAQGTPLLLLDEPTTFLDIAHQVEVLDLLLDLNRAEGRTIVMVLHDLNQASRYADHIIAMAGGRILAEGPPAEVVTEELVAAVFDLPCRVIPDPVSGTPLVIPIGTHHRHLRGASTRAGYIRNRPRRGSGSGAFAAVARARPRTVRVSAGSITPSSQRRAVE